MNIPISTIASQFVMAELERLRQERPAVVQAIKEAREEGDLSENAGYDAARERQGMLEARISYLEFRISSFNVIDLDTLSSDKIIYGATVRLADQDTDEIKEYTLLGADEIDMVKGSISVLSPVAQAILGKEVGDEVIVDVPRGKVHYEVIDVQFRGSSMFNSRP